MTADVGLRDERANTPRVTIHQLRATLDEIEPPIWRRLHVRSDVTLAQLHEAIQVAMGWENYHLHAFGASVEAPETAGAPPRERVVSLHL